MRTLFDNTTINGLSLKNRFVRSATWEGLATVDGNCTDNLTGVMTSLADGGVGLIITGHAYIEKIGQAGPRQLGIYDSELLEGHTRMVEEVHKKNGKIILQIAHAGIQASQKLTGLRPIGPSVIRSNKGPMNDEMTLSDIERIINTFASSALLAKKAGYDGIQIHGAHGYLLSQFLSPHFNHRKDEFGGDLSGRSRIVIKTLESVRESVGANYPVLIKLNSQDFLEEEFTSDEMIKVSKDLQHAGLDAIEMSGGTPESGKNSPVRKSSSKDTIEAPYYKTKAETFKKNLDIPLILVGGIRSFETSASLIQNSISDYISLCRPLIKEPHLINRWKTGDMEKSGCISCNKCFMPVMRGKGIYCPLES